MTTVESILSRELGLRFIDARYISNEAKVSLGIHGYPTSDQFHALREEAIRLYNEKPQEEKLTLRQLQRWHQDTTKPSAQTASTTESETSSSISACEQQTGLGRLFRRNI